ncbi:MAG: thymidine phosphorylase [Anaerolineae bacterium]
MDAVQLIERKRDGAVHTADELQWLVRGVVDESIPDYQLSSWLMAVVWRGMTRDETGDFTLAMAHSGDVLDLSGLPGTTADKHSTGGVGDKTSLVACPMAAACGVTVAKMSGRGLGHTGGTLDKLESIPGVTVDLGTERFMRQAADVGLVIAGQSADLAPADKRLYALRDVTGTVPSQPLIASSIMCKKIAAGAEAIALDVKVGSGAFAQSEPEARALAELMVDLGADAGRPTGAVLTRMDQPLGHMVGNGLEVREACAALRGSGPADLMEVSLAVAGLMLVAAGLASSVDSARPALKDAMLSGRAKDKLASMIEAQGGAPETVDDTSRLPAAAVVRPVTAERAGYVTALDALAVGQVSVDLGAGRRSKDDRIDPAAGVELIAKTGSTVARGEEIALVHAADPDAAEAARSRLAQAFTIGDAPPAEPSIVIDTLLPSPAGRSYPPQSPVW